MAATTIKKITAEEISDSRGNPTLKVTMATEAAEESFAVPSGASTGKHEALELRDKDGRGVSKAIANVNGELANLLVGQDALRQGEIDEKMIALDGMADKSRMGGNALIGVSVACSKVAAKSLGLETFVYLRRLADIKPSGNPPFLFINLINGGKHARSNLSFQEYLIVPQTEDVAEALAMADAVQKSLGQMLEKEFGFGAIKMGDEGGFSLNVDSSGQPLEFLARAVEENKFAGKVRLALDVAASSFFDSEKQKYILDGRIVDAEELAVYHDGLIKNFDITSVEDPFQEEDFLAFAELKEKHPEVLVVGDDLTVTSPKRLRMAIDQKSVGGLIIKPNQAGTLTETLMAMKLARDNNLECIVSHRSGETEDNFIADLSYAFGCLGLKSGAPQPKERAAKYNRLKNITLLK